MRDDARPNLSSAQYGFSLIEVMVAAVVAGIAVVGLAFSFSAGRGLIDRYATARDALQAAQRRLDVLAMEAVRDPAVADLAVGSHPATPRPLVLNRNQTGLETWTVSWFDDPVDNVGGDTDRDDYKRVTVAIRWQQGGLQDSIRLSRTFLGP